MEGKGLEKRRRGAIDGFLKEENRVVGQREMERGDGRWELCR